jgi:hypothetical protein
VFKKVFRAKIANEIRDTGNPNQFHSFMEFGF